VRRQLFTVRSLAVSVEKKYTQLHFFLDESGNLSQNGRNDPLVVGGTLNLHIANRSFVFDPRKIDPKELESLGLKVGDYKRRKGRKVVRGMVNEREVVAMLRMAIRQRWPNVKINLGLSWRSAQLQKTNERSYALLFARLLGFCQNISDLVGGKTMKPGTHQVGLES
jgi:hypothetical protein